LCLKGRPACGLKAEREAAEQPWEAGVENNLGSVAQTKLWFHTWSSGLKALFEFTDASTSA